MLHNYVNQRQAAATNEPLAKGPVAQATPQQGMLRYQGLIWLYSWSHRGCAAGTSNQKVRTRADRGNASSRHCFANDRIIIIIIMIIIIDVSPATNVIIWIMHCRWISAIGWLELAIGCGLRIADVSAFAWSWYMDRGPSIHASSKRSAINNLHHACTNFSTNIFQTIYSQTIHNAYFKSCATTSTIKSSNTGEPHFRNYISSHAVEQNHKWIHQTIHFHKSTQWIHQAIHTHKFAQARLQTIPLQIIQT